VLTIYARLEALADQVGHVLGIGEWVTIDQARVDAFAAATQDSQWIHVDPARAAEGPFGGTVAHGFLTLSLFPALIATAYRVDGLSLTLNYGLNRVRFPAVLPVGSRVRGHFKLLRHDPIEGGAQQVVEMTVERDGHPKPVCVAEAVLRHYVSQF
jgi:acyl dehydratase